MSRNLGQVNCRECPGEHKDIILDEKPRSTVERDCGVYFTEYQGLIVANAHCRLCHTLYLAWVDFPRDGTEHFSLDAINRRLMDGEERQRFVDLSYQNSFNDEPAEIDTPLYVVEQIVTYRRRPATVDEHTYRRAYPTKAWEKRQAEELARGLSLADEGVKEP